MSFEKLLESAKQLGNEAFVTDFETAIAESTAAMSNSTDRVKVLETELEGSISKKNKLRDLIKSNTGLEEISEDNFTKYLSDIKTSGASEALKGDNEKLQGLVSEYKATIDSTKSEYEKKISNMSIDLTILESGELSGIDSSVAKGLILEKIREGAIKGEKGVSYVDANGSTVLKADGTPLTITDKVESLRSDSDYGMFFPEKRKRGGGKGVNDNDASHGVRDLSKLTRSEKAELMASMSSADYQALVRANLNKGK